MDAEDARLNATKRTIKRILTPNKELDFTTLFQGCREEIGVGRSVFSQALNQLIGSGDIEKTRIRVDNKRRRIYRIKDG